MFSEHSDASVGLHILPGLRTDRSEVALPLPAVQVLEMNEEVFSELSRRCRLLLLHLQSKRSKQL